MGASLGMLAASTRRMCATVPTADASSASTASAVGSSAAGFARGSAGAGDAAGASAPASSSSAPALESYLGERTRARAKTCHRRRFGRSRARVSRASFAPLVHDLELAALERAPAPRARDLARGRLLDRARPQQVDAAEARAVRARDRAAHDVDGARQVGGGRVGDLRDEREHFAAGAARAAAAWRREGRAAAAAQHARARVLGRALDVLRVVVAAADDDEVLQPAADEELAAVHEAEVARAQITHRRAAAAASARGRARRRAEVGVAREPAAEVGLGLLGHVPVAFRAARRAHPHLADAVVREPLGALGRDDRDVDAARGRVAAADHARDGRALARRALGPLRVRVRPQHLLVDEPHLALDLERLAVDDEPLRAVRAHEHRVLGEAVP